MAGHGWGSRRPGPQDMRPAPGTRPATDEELACKLCGWPRLACTFSDCPGDRTPEPARPTPARTTRARLVSRCLA